MQRWRGVEAAPPGWGRCVVTIGIFDGVHRGHRAIIGRAVERARAAGQPLVVVTFDPHPSEVVRPGSHPAMLTSQRHKAELLEELGVDVFCVIPFTLEFSRLEPQAFAVEVLVEYLHASAVVVGANFRFGHNAAGDVAKLTAFGRRFGFEVEAAPLVSAPADGAVAEGTTYSSTFIRACVAGGDVETAAIALGRPHRLEGIVVRGDARGRSIGFPTANLETHRFAAIPADGVYAGWLIRKGERLPAAIHVGSNATFEGRDRRVEAYILDLDVDLYGEHLGLDFVTRLRGSERFESVEALVEQMGRDIARTREILTG